MATLFLALTLGGVGCSQNGEEKQEGDISQLIISASDAGRQNSEYPQGRAVDNNYATIFTQGDQIGLFAVKDGTLVEDLKNVPLTFNGTGWTPKTPLLYDEEEGASITYYAYYPYKFDLSSKPVSDGEDFFANIVAEWETGKDQSTQVNYSSFDLMTSGATHVTNPNGRFSLQFSLEHRMGLLVLQLPTTEYEFVDGDGNPISSVTYQPEPYILPPTDVSFHLGSTVEGNEVKPFLINNLYHLLVNPLKEQDIVGQFNNRKYKISTSSIEAGKYKKNVVDGGKRVVKHHLQVGDFYCADGSIVSVEQTPPENCIGIVFYAGETRPSKLYPAVYKEGQDVLLREHATCNHGLVLALNETDKKMYAKTKLYNLGTTLKDAPFAGSYISVADPNAAGSISIPHMVGYNNTRATYKLIDHIKEKSPDVAVEDISYLSETLKTYSEQVATSSSLTTSWFLPSNYEWNMIYTNRSAFNGSLSAVGGKELNAADFYWTSTERNGSNQWYYSAAGYAFTGKTSSAAHYRFTLAF